MRRESSTVVVLVGDVDDRLPAGLAQSPNVSVARAPTAGTGAAVAGDPAAAQPTWVTGAAAMPEAARRRPTCVIVPDDPLADVATGWRAMWDVSAGPQGAAGFEAQADGTLAAWTDKRFELPDYYLVVTPAHVTDQSPDLYLGPLRSLEHGLCWPPLDELIDTARHFYAGSLAEAQPTPTLRR